ncbi:MAG: cytochrome P450 [Actinomycetales bacterium]|nr:cytochrome P450 [Actinomycetales bacterium]
MTDMLMRQTIVDEEADAERRKRFPIGAKLEFDDLQEAGRESALDQLRAAEPVSWVPALGGWLVTSRAAARTVLSPRTDVTVEVAENLVRASLGRMMLTTDADEHARLRRPFERPFKLSTVRSTFGEVIVEEADSLLAAMTSIGTAELGESFAAPFAVRMAGRMLGLSLGETAEIDRIYAAFAAAMVYDGNPEPQRDADRARAELDAILHAELDRCRRHPEDSITSQVVADPEGLTDEEIVAQLRVIMFGAVETIQASVMNTLLLLFQHPGQFAEVSSDPSLIGGAADEAIRLVPPVAFVERWTSTPLEVDGVVIPAGEFVGISVLAANRDPATFPDPTSFDMRRSNAARALSFAFGIHACLGVHLAKIETATALERMFMQLPDLRLIDHDPPSGFAFRRPARLTVSWRV